jgi:hypothetical protein
MSSGNSTAPSPQTRLETPFLTFGGVVRREEESTPLLQSALHRLAQPLMASLCISEFLGNASGESLEQTLDQELRRAVAVFLFLQELLEVRRSSCVVHPVCMTELLKVKLGVLEADPTRGALGVITHVPDRLMCSGNLKALDRTLDFMFGVLRRAVLPGRSIEISARSHESALELRLLIPTDQGEQLAAQLHDDARLFDSKDFDFHNRKLPEVALVQQSLEAFGGDLSMEGTNVGFSFVLGLQHPQPPALFVSDWS